MPEKLPAWAESLDAAVKSRAVMAGESEGITDEQKTYTR
jgi:hypothetical protein